MPRVEVRRLAFVWMAYRVDDYGERGPRRFGFNKGLAVMKAAMA